MGTIIHDAVVVVVHSNGDEYANRVAEFRAYLPDEFQPLVIGPVPTVVNMMEIYAFLPDGSKEGWMDSYLGDKFRDEFIDLFDRYAEGVTVRFGHDLEHAATAANINEEES